MKKILVLPLAAALVLFGAASLFAQSSDDEKSSAGVNKILSEIRSDLHLAPNDRIDPSKVPDEVMTKLGDAVMDLMVPNQQQHEYMDRMMGGEGSASLDSMHRWIAYRYLTGGYNGAGHGYGAMGRGMMGGGMMGYGNGYWGMMGNPDVPYGASPYESPEQVAKRRYAAGEITRDQYLQIMKDIQSGAKAGSN